MKKKIPLKKKGSAKCGFCGDAVSPTSKKCMECGAEFIHPDVVACSNCGAMVPSDSDRCTNCGARFAADTPEPYPVFEVDDYSPYESVEDIAKLIEQVQSRSRIDEREKELDEREKALSDKLRKFEMDYVSRKGASGAGQRQQAKDKAAEEIFREREKILGEREKSLTQRIKQLEEQLENQAKLHNQAGGEDALAAHASSSDGGRAGETQDGQMEALLLEREKAISEREKLLSDRIKQFDRQIQEWQQNSAVSGISDSKAQLIIKERERNLAEREKMLEERLQSIEEGAKDSAGSASKFAGAIKDIEARDEYLKEREEVLRQREAEMEERLQQQMKSKEEQVQRVMKELASKERALQEAMAAAAGKAGFIGGEISEKDKKALEKDGAYRRLVDQVRDKDAELKRLTDDFHMQRNELEHLKDVTRYKEDEMNRRDEDLKYREDLLRKELEKAAHEKANAGTAKDDAREKELRERIKLLEEEIKQKEEEVKRREEYLLSKESELNERGQKLIEKDLEKKTAAREEMFKRKKLSIGTPRIDDLLLGGVPPGTNVLVYGPTFIGKEVLINVFAADGLNNSIPIIFVSTDKTPAEIRREMEAIIPIYKDYEKAGLVRYVDIYSKRMDIKEGAASYIDVAEYEETGVMRVPSAAASQAGQNGSAANGAAAHPVGGQQGGQRQHTDKRDPLGDAATPPECVEHVYSIKNIEAITQAIKNAQDYMQKFGTYRMIFPLSTMAVHVDRITMFRFIQRITSEVKRDMALAMFPLNKDMFPDIAVQTYKHPMDGVIEFKTENQRTFLCVQGITDVQTRAWVQYTYTETGLSLGSFSLTRIR